MFSNLDIKQAMDDGDFNCVPFDERLLQPASLDLRLGDHYLVLDGTSVGYIDPAQDQRSDIYRKVFADRGHFLVHPGAFLIATTLERLTLSGRIVGRVEGKSSLGRLGLLVHSTAGFFDPGFNGEATLEIANVSGVAIKLYVGMPICQFAMEALVTPTDRPYNGKYAGQTGPQGSRYFQNFEPGGIMSREGRD